MGTFEGVPVLSFAYVPAQFLQPRNLLRRFWQLFDFLTMRNLHGGGRGRTTAALVVLIALFYVLHMFSDFVNRFHELNQKVHRLNADLEVHKRRTYYMESERKGSLQHKVARDVLQSLGPAVQKPLVRKKPPEVGKPPKDTVIPTSQPPTPNGSVPLPVLNPHDFNYILNNASLCAGSDILMYIVYVHTSPSHFRRRQTMRETWAQSNLFKDFHSRLIFFLGKTTDKKLQDQIQKEFIVHGDIIQEDFKDDYHNLTYKGISALKWISTYCSQAKYVFKSDDDTFVNIFLLVDLLRTTYVNEKRFVLCMWWDNMKILRNTDSSPCFKWCLTDRHFPGRKFFPRYCSGAAYFLSGDVIAEMYNASLRLPFFWIDDVYITGLLPRKVPGMTWLQEIERYRYDTSAFYEHYKTSKKPQLMVTIVSDEELGMKRIWYLVLKRLSDDQISLIGESKYKALLESATLSIGKNIPHDSGVGLS